MKKLIIILLLFNIFTFPAKAESNVFLEEQAEIAGVDEIEDNLPDETREFFAENGIEPSNGEWVNSFGIKKVFSTLFDMIKKGMKIPLACAGVILAVILVSSTLSNTQNGISATTAEYAVTAVSAATIMTPLLSVINMAVDIMNTAADFMLAFVPVFAVVVAASGNAATSVSMSSLLLGASEAVSFVANNLVIPLMCGYLSISIASGVSPLLERNSIAEGIKRLSFWIMSLVTTVYVGILSIQTAVNSSADSLAGRTAKFIIGSSVPVAGTVLSEAFTTVTASLGLLKTSVAIYGVIACCVIFLPVLLELLLWRLIFHITSFCAEMLSTHKIAHILRSADTAVAVLCGMILLICAMFIISLTVVVSAGKKV